MKNYPILSSLALALVCALATSCSPRAKKPSEARVVQGEPRVEVLSDSKKSANGNSQTQAVRALVKFNKEATLGREFLFSSDLQYSSAPDEGFGLILQSVAVGHVPVHFEVRGEYLELVADQKILFESDINHPEKLIQKYKIREEDSNTLTVEVVSASPSLTTIMTDEGAPKGPQPPLRQTWVRSVDFVPEKNMLLVESSIETADGKIAEFMEALLPRASLVKNGTQPLFADAAREALAGRYRFLSFGPVYMNFGKDRVQTKTANRYDISEGQTIDWYVTPNIPTEYVVDVKNAIEAWNRYYQKMFGRDVVVFKGLLPAGVKIGDPRYNVVNWDSVAKAGAAYASSATDPLSGITSHSLIYMPYAWINIGKDYWNAGRFNNRSEKFAQKLAAKMKTAKFLGRPLNINCVMDATKNLSLKSRKDPELFARELLKGTLMHEVGHALGLDHNFKASLVYNPESEGSIFSTSIMDYNQYHLEHAFDSVDSAKGPLLEYDRQIISALYNSSKDVSATDAVLPACGDEESDAEEGGVDPLCIRYDASYDPTLYMKGLRNLFESPAYKLGPMKSLSEALTEIKEELGDATQFSSLENVTKEVAKIQAYAAGTLGYYLAGNANSLSYMTRANLRMLHLFKEGSLPATYDAKALRSRTLEGLEYLRTLKTLPEAPTKSYNDLTAALEAWVSRTTYVNSLDVAKRPEAIATLVKSFKELPQTLGSEEGSLTAVRSALWASLKRSEKAPYEFFEGKDLEALVVSYLKEAVVDSFDSKPRAFAERKIAAASLETFKDVHEDVLEAVKNSIKEEAAKTQVAKDREELRKILKILNGEAVEKKEE